jgi:hypothetical protein
VNTSSGQLSDKDRLALARSRLAGVSKNWIIVADSNGFRVEVDAADGPEEIMTFAETASYDDREFILNAASDVRFLLGLVDRSITRVRELKAKLPELPDYAAQSAMLCADPAFKKYMAVKHGLEAPLTDDRVATRLRSILSISSRSDLNTSDPAAERWKALVSSFENWKRHG